MKIAELDLGRKPVGVYPGPGLVRAMDRHHNSTVKLHPTARQYEGLERAVGCHRNCSVRLHPGARELQGLVNYNS